jgi:hypothetical protein
MSETKIGDIYIEKAETVRAFWRPLDGSPDVLLATMNLYVHESHPSVREMFTNLAAIVAINLNRSVGQTIVMQHVSPVQPSEARIDRRQFSCWSCTHPQAADARGHLGAFSDADLEASLTSHGTPTFCCKVMAAGRFNL